jgi:hypothetical protein
MDIENENSILKRNVSLLTPSEKIGHYHNNIPLHDNPERREQMLLEAESLGLTRFQVDPGRRQILCSERYIWSTDTPMLLALVELLKEGLVKFQGTQGRLAIYVNCSTNS